MSAKDKLLELQFIQLEHDKYFHPDILSLPVQRRVCHMALHYAKYAGKLVVAKKEHNRELLVCTLVDAFIIGLAVANMFNKKLSELTCLSDLPDEKDINQLARQLTAREKIRYDDIFAYAADSITVESGKIAKAIESLDHLENYPYRSSVVDGLSKIIEVVMICISLAEADLCKEVCDRLTAVEKKSIFYSLYRK
jgi:hypothetical protein